MFPPDQRFSIFLGFPAFNRQAAFSRPAKWLSATPLCGIARRRFTRRCFACLGAIGLAIFLVLDHQPLQAQETSQRKTFKKTKEQKLTYPLSRRSDHVDHYHGVAISDPYRWLEDLDSAETRRWVKDQNQLTFGYLQQIPQRGVLKKRLTKLWNYERFGVPHKKGSRYFYTRNDGLQNQSILYVAESLEAEPRVLLDPNKLSDDGTVALAGWEISEDGEFMAYSLAADGSDWRQWKVLEVKSGRELSDHLKWVKFSGVSWTPDNQGFFYSRYDEPPPGEKFTGANYYQKLYYHHLGQDQSQDQLVYQRQDEKEWGFDGHVTEDGRYLIISVWRGTEPKNQIFYKDMQAPDSKVVELIAGFDAEYSFVGNKGSLFWVMTDLDAPMKRLVAIDVSQPRQKNWKETIAEAAEALRGVNLVGGRFFASYLKDAQTKIRTFDLKGRALGEVKLPAVGSAGGFSGRSDENETFFWFSNYTTPTAIYRYDVASGKREIFRKPKVDFNPEDYQTKQVFYKSRDGARIPMFITHRKGVKLNGDNPTILYGYGGFNISLTPSFSVSNLVWLEAGGVYAVANLRGGGEYGSRWHEAGMQGHKQNVFDDFLSAAQWLKENKYTSSKKLAIRGGSNGGLLVGAAMTQRPELFAAALPAVGVMDMLRYHKFTIGWAWVSEYGSSDDSGQFKTLAKYSPLHNLKKSVRYPATLITTADHDDRVVPGHSYKFAATLQTAHGGVSPVLIRIETSAGHGAGTPTTKRIEAAADSLSFLVKVLDVDY